MAKNRRTSAVGGGLVVALALAAIYFNHPNSSWLVVLGVALFLSLMYTVSGWYTKSGLSTAECFGRFIAALILWGAVVGGYTAQFWPPPPITVNPEHVTFNGYPDETFNFSVRNGRSEDVYDVQIPFLIGYGKHFDDKFSVKVMPNSDPPQRIYIRYNYCYGVKGDGVVSHVQAKRARSADCSHHSPFWIWERNLLGNVCWRRET